MASAGGAACGQVAMSVSPRSVADPDYEKHFEWFYDPAKYMPAEYQHVLELDAAEVDGACRQSGSRLPKGWASEACAFAQPGSELAMPWATIIVPRDADPRLLAHERLHLKGWNHF